MALAHSKSPMTWRSDRYRTFAAAAFLALMLPGAGWCCGGTAGRNVSITYDGQKYTVSNVGRQWLQVTFAAWNETYNLQLAPGQSASPRAPGVLGHFMTGYQSCSARPIPSR